jgi:hypothetical protein
MTMLKTIGIAAAALFALGACSSTLWGMRGQTWRMQNTGQLPAAQGIVKIASAPHDNTVVRINLKHVPPAEKVSPDANVYVAWAKASDSDRPVALGSLKPGENRKAVLETVTTMRNFDLTITPEKSPYVERPTAQPVLAGRIDR